MTETMAKRILVAEDSPTQATRVQLLLEGEGYDVDVVTSGREGLERVRSAPPHLIVSDVVMPEMNGYEFCRAVKALPVARDIPFVLLTDRRSPLDIVRGLEAGADNFITKPFEDEGLLERVRRIFEHAAARGRRELQIEASFRLGEREIRVSADKQQIFELLFSTLEETSLLHGQLERSQEEVAAYARTVEVMQALRDSEERRRRTEASFRLLFASNPLPMWVYDQETLYFLEVNDAAVEHYGYSHEEFLRMRLTDIRPPEEVARLRGVLDGMAAESTAGVRRHAGTWRHRLKDGRLRDVDIASHAIEFAGRPATLVVATDVTEVKQAEVTLAKYAERLTILHEIDAAIIAAKPPLEIAEVALRRLRDLLGVPRAIVNLFDLPAGEAEWLAAVGRRRAHLGPGVRFPLALMGDLDGLQRGELQVIDVDALPSSRHARALLASGVHVYMVVPMLAGGELIGGLSFGGVPREFSAEQINIADEVAAQLAIAIAQARLRERVARQASELEQRVAERTLALTAANARLQAEIAERERAEAEADRANRAKSEFLSRMSHELRTPLNGILGFAQLLERDALGDDQRESVEQILKGGRHLLALINEVLDIARIEAGRLALSPEPVSTREVFRSALDLIRPQAAARGMTLAPERGPDRHVVADRQRLQQVLLNLLSNAVKYTGEGGTVTCGCADGESGFVQLAVGDTGPGIAPDMLERLYTPFDRLGAEQTGIEGTGLGLALSRRLVEAMNGRLLVDSRVGEGTTFTVELPAATEPAASVEGPEGAAGAEVGGAGTAGTVLYIEDNLANVRLFERIVALRPGLTLLSAMQGRRGLDLALDHRPRLIVLDLHLPDVSGQEVLACLRGDPRTRDIPVVILSADATVGQVTALRAQGAREYLTKPVDVSSFLTLLDTLLAATGE